MRWPSSSRGRTTSTRRSPATANNAILIDIHAIFEDIKAHGYEVGGITFTNALLQGGLFSADGFHPSNIAHAIIADEIIKAINRVNGANIPEVNFTAAFFTPNVPPAAATALSANDFWRSIFAMYARHGRHASRTGRSVRRQSRRRVPRGTRREHGEERGRLGFRHLSLEHQAPGAPPPGLFPLDPALLDFAVFSEGAAMMIPATQIRGGTLVIYNGELHRVHDMVHKTPGQPARLRAGQDAQPPQRLDDRAPVRLDGPRREGLPRRAGDGVPLLGLGRPPLHGPGRTTTRSPCPTR